MAIRLTQDEVREFYDHPLEPQRRQLLGEFQALVAALGVTDEDGAVSGGDRALLPQYQEVAHELKAVNETMQRDYWELRGARGRAERRAEEIRQQLESGALELATTGCR